MFSENEPGHYSILSKLIITRLNKCGKTFPHFGGRIPVIGHKQQIVDEQFTPYRRSQIWLGEPADAATYRDEGFRIAERLRKLETDELFDVAADPHADDRTRWQATLKLPREIVQRLANTLIQRSDDCWWATMVKLCPPSETAVTIEALRSQLQSNDKGCRHRAMQLLSKFGDDSFTANVHEMLESDDKIERLVAISCLAARGNEESSRILDDYATCDTNPIASRVDAATRLLRMGNKEYSSFLAEIARKEQSESAYYAACGIQHHHDRIEAFQLFLHIVSQPEHPAAPVTVMHITTLMGNHQLGFETEGLFATRRWLKSEIANAR